MPMWRRLGGWTWSALRGMGPALTALGLACGALLPLGWHWDDEWEEEPGTGPVLSEPGPGHPERLVAGVPLDAVEEQLWSQLTK
ncbi:DUF6059 family protein [Streptomyces sp. NPDC048191]|uniref:DUF6059 family protein n=1 Tax=Streptomyces sp. NPDC048191 TaxID=3155484 RepID=UPI0033BFBDA9